MRSLAPLLLLAACNTAPAAPRFANVEVALPEDTATYPDRPGVEAVQANCAACHSPSQILTQPRLTRAEWEKIVEKMREVYKAPIDPEAVPAIIEYLVATSEALPK